MKGSKKSRTGCCTCKKRKKKCDEAKPTCGACKRLGLECNYSMKLNWLPNSQFAAQKSCEMQRCDSSGSGMSLFVNFSSLDISASYTIDEMTNKGEHRYSLIPKNATVESDLGRISASELKKLQSDPLVGNKISESFLFNLYTTVLSRTKSFAGSEGIDNDFINIVIPGCQKFPALYRSVLALSSLNLIKEELQKPKFLQNHFLAKVYNSLFSQYKNDAINLLHDIIDGFDIDAVEMLEELVITIIILCNIEITNKGNSDWIRYLSEASLVFSALTWEKITNSAIFIFAYKYFSLRFILLLTTLDKETLVRFMDESPWPIIDDFFSSSEVEPMYGCSPQLLYIIYNSTILNHLYETNQIKVEKFVAKISKDWYYLEVCQRKDASLPDELLMSAKSYFHAAKIYIYTLLIRNRLELFLDSDFTEYIGKLWTQLNNLSQRGKSLFFPNWCFFIIATNETVEKEEAKRLNALQLLDILEINWPFSSVVEIRKAILTIWKIYDLSAPDNQEKFDYRSVLKHYQYKLALT